MASVVCFWGKHKMGANTVKKSLVVLESMKHVSILWTSNFSIYPIEMETSVHSKTNTRMFVSGSFTHNDKKLELTQRSINRWVDKHIQLKAVPQQKELLTHNCVFHVCDSLASVIEAGAAGAPRGWGGPGRGAGGTTPGDGSIPCLDWSGGFTGVCIYPNSSSWTLKIYVFYFM